MKGRKSDGLNDWIVDAQSERILYIFLNWGGDRNEASSAYFFPFLTQCEAGGVKAVCGIRLEMIRETHASVGEVEIRIVSYWEEDENFGENNGEERGGY
jgi:hypothetical protein